MLSPVRQTSPHGLRCFLGVERFSVKRPSPLYEVVILFVIRIGDGFKVLDVASNAANVFRWAVSLAFNTQRIPATILGLQAAFKQYLVFPAVAGVVLIQEAEPLAVRGTYG